MDEQRPESLDPQATVESVTDRRKFLGSIGAIGVAAAAGAMSSAPAQAVTPQTKLSSISSLNVTREQVLDIPGGKEYFYEWHAGDDKGAVTRFLTHSSRVDFGASYTMTTDITIHKYGPGMSLEGDPVSSKQQRITIFGDKGPVSGSLRTDQMIMTVVYPDGRVTRETKTVQVRLDLDEFAGQDFATLAANMGKRFVGGER